MLAVNEARTERALNDRHGTGQSALDGIIRASNVLLAGHTVVVVGYGWAGQGVAERARGAGAAVIVCEVDPLRALEARMAGYEVMPALEAAERGDIFVTVTGSRRVLRGEHFERMKDGALLANAGHFDVELDLDELRALATGGVREVRPLVEQYELADGRRLNLLARGRVVNLAAAEGHPAAVMDVSFALQALCVEELVRAGRELLGRACTPVPGRDRPRGRAAEARGARRRDRRADRRAGALPRVLELSGSPLALHRRGLRGSRPMPTLEDPNQRARRDRSRRYEDRGGRRRRAEQRARLGAPPDADRRASPPDVAEQMAGAITEAAQAAGLEPARSLGVGVGSPGVDRHRAPAPSSSARNLPGWDGSVRARRRRCRSSSARRCSSATTSRSRPTRSSSSAPASRTSRSSACSGAPASAAG